MSEHQTLTDHTEIREWAIARAGKPMLHYVSDGAGGETPVLSLSFGQHATHEGDLEHSTEGRQLVEWGDWFAAFEEQGLALHVPVSEPGVIDDAHQIVKR